MNMRILTVLLLGCIAVLNNETSAQCKYVKATKDEWTGKTMNTAQMAIGNALAGREVILQESGGTYYLGLRITFNTDFPDVAFKKGDKVSFKLANGEIIEVVSIKDLPPTMTRFMDVPVRMWFVNQDVSKEVFEKLSASPITAIRFRLNDADQDLPAIKDKQTAKIMETAKCMLETK
ncbi:hypothetical protein CAP35_12495 [Chitinophagaceae bacterium IBVUCB1]|nr:hypothetical protein CAP35_12495 [Chitinophagaceae bacterium IBVUCB1]